MVMVCLFTTGALRAQTWSEWFRQKKTQIKYLGEQIAALKVYGDYLSKGYSIARHGLTDIGDTKGTDLTMHTGYFTSLLKVAPRVKTYWKVAATTSLQVKIIGAYHKQSEALSRSKQFTKEETAYAENVYATVLDDCSGLLEQLISLTTDDTSEMKDDERLKGVDRIYQGMKEVYTFIKTFGSQVSVLAVQRVREGNDVKASRSLLNIQ